MAVLPLEIDLEQRYGTRELGRDPVVQLPCDAGALATDRILDRLVGEGVRQPAIRRANDPINAMLIG